MKESIKCKRVVTRYLDRLLAEGVIEGYQFDRFNKPSGAAHLPGFERAYFDSEVNSTGSRLRLRFSLGIQDKSITLDL